MSSQQSQQFINQEFDFLDDLNNFALSENKYNMTLQTIPINPDNYPDPTKLFDDGHKSPSDALPVPYYNINPQFFANSQASEAQYQDNTFFDTGMEVQENECNKAGAEPFTDFKFDANYDIQDTEQPFPVLLQSCYFFTDTQTYADANGQPISGFYDATTNDHWLKNHQIWPIMVPSNGSLSRDYSNTDTLTVQQAIYSISPAQNQGPTLKHFPTRKPDLTLRRFPKRVSDIFQQDDPFQRSDFSDESQTSPEQAARAPAGRARKPFKIQNSRKKGGKNVHQSFEAALKAERVYSRLRSRPASWGPVKNGRPLFEYNSDGELVYGRKYTASEIRHYIDNSPRELVLWVQQSPAQVSERLGTQRNKCCWECCPAQGKIVTGWLRVAFDEYPTFTTNGHKDPLKVAGQMHLFCFERCFDPAIDHLAGRLKGDVRALPKEDINPTMLNKSTCKFIMGDAFNPWFLTTEISNIRRQYKDTLSSCLVTHHLESQPGARHAAREARRKKQKTVSMTIDVHQGDLMMAVAAKNDDAENRWCLSPVLYSPENDFQVRASAPAPLKLESAPYGRSKVTNNTSGEDSDKKKIEEEESEEECQPPSRRPKSRRVSEESEDEEIKEKEIDKESQPRSKRRRVSEESDSEACEQEYQPRSKWKRTTKSDGISKPTARRRSIHRANLLRRK